jgi:hypothetical protein
MHSDRTIKNTYIQSSPCIEKEQSPYTIVYTRAHVDIPGDDFAPTVRVQSEYNRNTIGIQSEYSPSTVFAALSVYAVLNINYN